MTLFRPLWRRRNTCADLPWYSPSVLNQKFGALRLSSSRSVVDAETLDRGQDVIGRFGPTERLWIGVVLFDECGDRALESNNAAVDATSDLVSPWSSAVRLLRHSKVGLPCWAKARAVYRPGAPQLRPPRGDRMRRREFITLLGGAAAWPLAAGAQQPERMRRIGVLMSMVESDPRGLEYITAFAQGLAEHGWIVGRNVRIEYRWGAGDLDRFRRYAGELVALSPDVVLASAGSIVGAL